MKQFCKKVWYTDGGNTSRCALGVVKSTESGFVTLQTRSGEIMINKDFVTSIIETEELFNNDKKNISR